MNLESITEEVLREFVGVRTFQEAEQLYRAGHIYDRVVDEIVLEGVVRDGQRTYMPEVYDESNGLISSCDCPANVDHFCAHVTALLLTWLRERDTFMVTQLLDDFRHEDQSNMVDLDDLLNGDPDHIHSQPPTIREYLVELLNSLTLPKLREIAERRKISISGNRKEPIVNTLVDALSAPEYFSTVWAELSATAQKLLGILALMHGQGEIFIDELRKTYKAFESKASARLDATLDELARNGLIFPTAHASFSLSPLIGFQLPPDPGFVPLHSDQTRLQPDPPAASPLDFTMLLTHVLLLIKAGGDRFRARPVAAPHPIEQQIPILQGWPHDPKELDALARERNPGYSLYTKNFRVLPAPSLLTDEARDDLCRNTGADAARIDYAVRMLVASGLIVWKPAQPLQINENGFTTFIDTPALQRALITFNISLEMSFWSEVDRLVDLDADAPQLRHTGNIGYAYYDNYAAMLQSFAVARMLLVFYLRRAPAMQWVDLEAFVTRAHAFQNSRSFWPLHGNWYLQIKNRRANVANLSDWKATYTPFVEAVLSGPLYWQGLIELSNRGKQAVAFRITDFGARVMGQSVEYQLPIEQHEGTGPALNLTSDGDLILNTEHATTEALSLVTQLCDAHSDQKGRLLFRPTASGASRLFESGWTVEQLIESLQNATGKTLPKTLTQTFESWWRNFGDIHLYSDIAIVELGDDYALSELLAATSLSQHLLYRFSPRLIAVRADGVDALRDEWVKKGYTPKTINYEP